MPVFRGTRQFKLTRYRIRVGQFELPVWRGPGLERFPVTTGFAPTSVA
jgi:hypothetical protein